MLGPADVILIGLLVAVVAVPIWILLENPTTLLYLMVLYLPFEEFVEKWLPDGPVLYVARFGGELLLLAALLHILAQKINRGDALRWSPLDVALAAFLVVAALSTAINDVSITVAGLGLRVLLRYIAAFYIVINLDIDTAMAQKMVRGLVVTATVVSVIALFQALIGASFTEFLLPSETVIGGQVVKEAVRGQLGERTRVFATLGRYDTLGTFLTVVLLVSGGLYTRLNRADIRLIRVLWLFALPALALSYSRQSWVAVYVGGLTVVWFARRPRTLAALIVVPPVLVLTTALLFPDAVAYSSDRAQVSLISRFLEPFSPEYLDISRNRFGRLYVLLEVGARIFERALWLGFGPGSFGSLTSRFLGFESGSLVDVPEGSAFLINDVNWITLLGQVGAVGLACFVWMLVRLGRTARRVAVGADHDFVRGLALGYVGLVVAFGLLGFFGPNFEVRQVSFYFWLLGGLVVALAHREKLVEPPLPRHGGR